jgi:tripartite-type tricarboxylate transporter receptor subunit TctC
MAQAWPSKPVTLVVPFPAGGTTDVLARALAEKLTLSLGQPVIVESKPGAGATLGADHVAKSKPTATPCWWARCTTPSPAASTRSCPTTSRRTSRRSPTIALVPNVLVVNANTPARNVAELVALLKAKPGEANYGSNGNGTAQHLIGTQFENMTGAEIRPHPLQGQRPAGHRPAGRADHDVLRHRDAGAAAHQGRQAAGAGRDHRASARPRCPTCPRWTKLA